ncbi:GNAT family N-acetyltransferase [Roseomonas sp. F4]
MSGHQPNLNFQPDRQDLSLGWVTDPPIRLLDEGEVALCGRWLINALKQFLAEPGNTPEFANRLTVAQERGEVLELETDPAQFQVYAYFHSGKPVGMMSIDRPESLRQGSVHIDSLAGHPAARNVGDILIEFAANLSQSRGAGGRVTLTADVGTRGFYESVGFQPRSGGWNEGWTGCVLRPRPPQWRLMQGRWVLTGLWQMRDPAPVLMPHAGPLFRN